MTFGLDEDDGLGIVNEGVVNLLEPCFIPKSAVNSG